MEFRLRAGDDKSPSYLPTLSGTSYFSEQALRAGNSSSDLKLNPALMRNPCNTHEAFQLQIEKERIREEIIASEIARRRILDAEVRRELMMEREMALHRSTEGLSFEERLAIRCDPRFSLMLEERFGFWGRKEFGVSGGFDTLSARLPKAMGQEVKPPSEVNENKLIILAKPDPHLWGSKRKAETQPAIGSAGSKKTPGEEWSCGLCKVSATSEKGLNEHLQGKKHKAMEAGLTTQKMGKKKNGRAGKVEGTAEFKKKKFKFWCEACQVGAYAKVVMETHTKGKKHLARLLEVRRNSEAVPTTTSGTIFTVPTTASATAITTVTPSAATQKEEDAAEDVTTSAATQKEEGAADMTKEANDETTESFDAEANESDSSPVVN